MLASRKCPIAKKQAPVATAPMANAAIVVTKSASSRASIVVVTAIIAIAVAVGGEPMAPR